MTFTDSSPDPQHDQSPGRFAAAGARTQIPWDTDTDTAQTARMCLILHAPSETAAWSLFFPPMVVIIFGHLARDGVTMETTKQRSP